MPQVRKIFFGIFLLLTAAAGGGYAESTSYDPYVSQLRQSSKQSALREVSTDFLVYPFELIRWPVDKALVYIEKHYVDKKVIWMYEESIEHGFTPHLGVLSVTNPYIGGEVDWIRLARIKDNIPNSIAKSWIDYAGLDYFGVGSEAGWTNIADLPVKWTNWFQYEMRHKEHFYGVGPESSKGDGSVFALEQTNLETKLSYEPSPVYAADFKFGYDNVNISGGKDGGRGQVGLHPSFPPTLDGIRGDELLHLGLEFNRDTRDHKANSKSGSRQRAGFSYYEGLYGSDARYLKYEFQSSHYFRVGSERRVVAANFQLEHNQDVNGHVPFHQMAKLGGFGSRPHLSETLRGFVNNRFFDESMAFMNLEYRYTIWEYRELKSDAVFFYDGGHVFGDLDEYQLKDWQSSYGLGLRLSIADVAVLSVELAHSNEGTNFYVKSSAPF